jgi:hypothetical protein
MAAQGGRMTHRTARIAVAASITVCLGLAACAGATAPEAAEPSATAPARPAPAGSTYTTRLTGDLHDFDFLAGAWTVQNRRLKARGVGSTAWDEFPATICATIHLGSVANVDEIVFPTKGWSGLTLRTFDTAKKQWSIFWVNSRTGTMFPPNIGGFDGDVGEFYGEDTDDGKPVKVRFRWTKRGPDRASWEQAFSPDGVTWETNWTNELVRADPAICAR